MDHSDIARLRDAHYDASIQKKKTVEQSVTRLDALINSKEANSEAYRAALLNEYLNSFPPEDNGGGNAHLPNTPPPKPSSMSREMVFGDLKQGDVFFFQGDAHTHDPETAETELNNVYMMKREVFVLIASASNPQSVGNIDMIDTVPQETPVVICSLGYFPETPFRTRTPDNVEYYFDAEE